MKNVPEPLFYLILMIRSGEKDYREKWQNEMIGNAVLPAVGFVLLLFIVLSLGNSFARAGIEFDTVERYLYYLRKQQELYFPFFWSFHEFEIRLELTDKLCHLNKATNCNTVLHDKASRIFGWFGWADAGFIYFTLGLLYLYFKVLTDKDFPC